MNKAPRLSILVTGGAGYIGSHVVRRLLAEGHEVHVYDSLLTGHAAAVAPQAVLHEAELADYGTLAFVLQKAHIQLVVHLAAFTSVSESIRDPDTCYRQNLYHTLGLLHCMMQQGVTELIFASSCAVYRPSPEPMHEHWHLDPLTPYGHTKLAVEHALEAYAHASLLRSVVLRCFNAAGAHPAGDIGEAHRPETHLLPNILRVAAGQTGRLLVHGNEHNTPDGTCIRDYIHVEDIAEAVVQAVKSFAVRWHTVVNIGSGQGTSVIDLIKVCTEVTGRHIPWSVLAPRPGDPSHLVADIHRADLELYWRPQYNLHQIVETAWKWHTNHPHGYFSL